KLEYDIALFSKIDGFEVASVFDHSDAVAFFSQSGLPFFQCILVRYRPGDVVDRSDAEPACRLRWNGCDDMMLFRACGFKVMVPVLYIDWLQSHLAGKQFFRTFRIAGQQYCTVEPEDLIDIRRFLTFDDRQLKSVHIIELNRFFAEKPGRFHFDVLCPETLFPETQIALRHSESDSADLAAALSSVIIIRPWEESDDRPRRRVIISEIQVIHTRVVKVDRLFDQPESQDISVKSQIFVRVPDDCCYMVDPFDCFHIIAP